MSSFKNRDDMLEQIYNLVLDSDISATEREILLEAKKQLENNSDYLQVVSNLKINLSSLALQFKLNKKMRNNTKTIIICIYTAYVFRIRCLI